jgi:hypothetical protein
MVVSDSPPGEDINVSVADESITVTIGTGNYLVKWFKNSDEYVGEMELQGGMWGAFSNEREVLDWRIEFYAPDGSEVLFTHHHLVEGSNVLLFVSFNGDSGKIDLNLLFEYANSLKQRGVSRVYCFMDESYKYDLESGGITPLRFNQHLEDRIEFSYVLNKTF